MPSSFRPERRTFFHLVLVLVLQSFNRDGSVDEIIKALVKRMEKQNWAVRLLWFCNPILPHSLPFRPARA